MIWCAYATTGFFTTVFIGLFLVNSAVADHDSRMDTNLVEANGGSTVEVSVGARLNVFLKVPPQEIYKISCLWSKINSSGDSVLQEVQKAVILPTGVTSASFRALQPGLVQLRSSRYDCSNRVMTEWYVNVRVTGI